jgi:hypothetical protein
MSSRASGGSDSGPDSPSPSPGSPGSPESPEERRLRLALRIAAREHGGVAPLPFIGTTWRSRGAAYAFRRALATLTLLCCAGVCGAFAAGVTAGLLRGLPAGAVGTAVAAVYWATAVPGLVHGIRMARRNPLGPARTGGGLGSGCVSAVITPALTGICLGYLLLTLGREFPGEPLAREVTDHDEQIRRLESEDRHRKGN